MSGDGPEAGRDKLARVFALLPEHRLLHVGHDLEDDAEHVERPANVILKIRRYACPRIKQVEVDFPLPGALGEDSSSVH